MTRTQLAVLALLVLVVIETSALAAVYVSMPHLKVQTELVTKPVKTVSVPFNEFNQPISNDTEYSLDQSYNGSWVITIESHLVATPSKEIGSEAQIAIAPEYPSENLSIPTIIVQERGDGWLRIEYFAQNWNNTYGLVLYNSSSPSWTNNNVTLRFTSFAPPVPVNPQLAPRPNGNLTITVGNVTVLLDYPIAWANLSAFYIYGLRGSNFASGVVYITMYSLKPRS